MNSNLNDQIENKRLSSCFILRLNFVILIIFVGYYTFEIQYGEARHSISFRVQVLETPQISEFTKLPGYVMVSSYRIINKTATDQTMLLSVMHA